MSAARPVILGIDGVARRLLEDAGAGIYVTPEEPAEFANAVLELQADSRRCEQYGQSGLAFVREHYSREKLARRYLEILEAKVLSAPRARAVRG